MENTETIKINKATKNVEDRLTSLLHEIDCNTREGNEENKDHQKGNECSEFDSLFDQISQKTLSN